MTECADPWWADLYAQLSSGAKLATALVNGRRVTIVVVADGKMIANDGGVRGYPTNKLELRCWLMERSQKF